MTALIERRFEDLGSTTIPTRDGRVFDVLLRDMSDVVVLNREIETLKAVVEQNRIDAAAQAAEIKLYREKHDHLNQKIGDRDEMIHQLKAQLAQRTPLANEAIRIRRHLEEVGRDIQDLAFDGTHQRAVTVPLEISGYAHELIKLPNGRTAKLLEVVYEITEE